MKRLKNKFIVAFTLLLSMYSFAQDGLPNTPEIGKCYAKCIEKDVYKDTLVRVKIKPAYKILTVVPAQYKKKRDSILISPEIKKYVAIPPVIKTIKEGVPYKDSFNKLTVVPVAFSEDIERIEKSPSVERWEMGGKAPNCESIDPNDCRLVWYKKYPSEYENVPIEVLKKDADTTSKKISFKSKIFEKKIIVKPASYKEVIVSPAKYKIFERMVLVKDETIAEKKIPEQYETVTIKKLVKKGGMTVWREVECDFITGKVIPIYYELADHRLTNKAKDAIDTYLLTMLLNEPLINVEISSHTDSRGNAQFNLDLSQKRAESVVSYLIDRGIDSKRLVPKGYGENKPINRCKDGVKCSDAAYAKNRRTEFRIIQ